MNKINLSSFETMLLSATKKIVGAQDELTDIDSRFGDADHGITMTKIAKSIEKTINSSSDQRTISSLLEDLSMAALTVNGGSAGPLWGTLLEGMASGAPDANEASLEDLKNIFTSALNALGEITPAKVGDKTMMDTLIPAVEALLVCEGVDISCALKAAAEAAEAGAARSAEFISKFGRAKSYKEKTIGTPDAGAVSMKYFFVGLYEGLLSI